MAIYRLEPVATHGADPQSAEGEGLSSDILLQDARWFTKIRWVVVVSFILFGVASTGFPNFLAAVRIAPPTVWPWILAGIVAMVNLVTITWLRRLPSGKTGHVSVQANIWFQIIADLLVLTVLVYLVGTVDTVMPFAYLFHIALACIFFAPRYSLVVLLLSAGLFGTTVLLELSDVLPPRSILAYSVPQPPPDIVAFLTTALPSVFVWAIVWFLVSHISTAVRQRDHELDIANQRLRKADRDKNRQVLRVAHDLKAPFAGIESNIEILRLTYWDHVPEEVRRIISRIETRGSTLRARIGDILTLGDLRSGEETPPTHEPVSLRELVDATIRDIQGLATQRNTNLVVQAAEGSVFTDPKQFKILLLNLLSNALTYSQENGTVEVTVSWTGSSAAIQVADHGIGIDEKALPHIFEDFYRSGEAAQFNTKATGLGLAIVRQVARNLGLTIIVKSTKGEGTVFEVRFPPERKDKDGNDTNH